MEKKETRRSFIKKSAIFTGASGLSTLFPASIQRALAINPAPGSNYLDAEHVVLLMLENRSFDHCFGTLKGVRGFNDPRAITLANGNPVWLQSDAKGHTYAPFRLNIRDTKATWMGALPHNRGSQVDAFNRAKFDKWLEAKQSPHKKYADMPLTLGYYNREDLPFNYAMADAFTICDQNFSSGMTSTHPNRLYFWTGTIRDPRFPTSKAYIRNPDLKTGEETWKTFPERLEEQGVSWRIYQNDLACGGGFESEERAWLSNYNCNPLEFFPRYNVKFSARNIESLRQQLQLLPKEIEDLKKKLSLFDPQAPNYLKIITALGIKKEVLASAQAELKQYSAANFEKLTPYQKSLYQRAFTINDADPDFHQLAEVSYQDGDEEKTFQTPKGDIFYQFRQDVNAGKLPTVSWMVPPHYFSDHPSKPMYGPWYISEILDILTKNEEVWKKTIFLVTYDENDGYFDHVPPFTPPDLSRKNTGKCSAGIDPQAEYISLEQELKFGAPEKDARAAPIGLGYRVPMLIASPWSRGGKVCSQVFDHTSPILFLEHFLEKKFGVKIKDENISAWRRTVSGNLVSSFSPYTGKEKDHLEFLKRDPFIEKIVQARSKDVPKGYRNFSNDEIEKIKKAPLHSSLLPMQERGLALSSALPYELYADGRLSKDRKHFEINMSAAKKIFGENASGSPFSVYAYDDFLAEDGTYEQKRNWQYAVAAGDTLADSWAIDAFGAKQYGLEVYGPNGFYRVFKGDKNDPDLTINCLYEQMDTQQKKLSGDIVLEFALTGKQDFTIELLDLGYDTAPIKRKVTRADNRIRVDLKKSFGWYDFKIKVVGFETFERRYAGRVETGELGHTDPQIGR